MVTQVQKKYSRTNIFIINEELWAWAQYKTKLLRHRSVSEYIFDLIKKEKEKDVRAQRRREVVEFVAKRYDAVSKEDLVQRFCNKWNEPPSEIQAILEIAKGAGDLSVGTLYKGTEKERTYIIHISWPPGEDGEELLKDMKLVKEVELRRSRIQR